MKRALLRPSASTATFVPRLPHHRRSRRDFNQRVNPMAKG
jgi:hypothetical protein